VLHYLAKHLGQVMTRETFITTVWGYDILVMSGLLMKRKKTREKIEDSRKSSNW